MKYFYSIFLGAVIIGSFIGSTMLDNRILTIACTVSGILFMVIWPFVEVIIKHHRILLLRTGKRITTIVVYNPR